MKMGNRVIGNTIAVCYLTVMSIGAGMEIWIWFQL